MIYVLVMSCPVHNQEVGDLDFQDLCMSVIVWVLYYSNNTLSSVEESRPFLMLFP